MEEQAYLGLRGLTSLVQITSGQNPLACSDNFCMLLHKTRPKGMGTNAGCRCLKELKSKYPWAGELLRIKLGVEWMLLNCCPEESNEP